MALTTQNKQDKIRKKNTQNKKTGKFSKTHKKTHRKPLTEPLEITSSP